MGAETVRKTFRIDRREIGFLRFILEGYDGLAFVTTLDREAGVVAVCSAPGRGGEVEGVLEALALQMRIEALDGWPAAPR